MTISKILVPIDFLPHSAEAVRRAMDLARQYSADVVLLHAHEPAQYPMSPGDIAYDDAQLEQLLAPVRARLEAVRNDVDPVGRRRVTTRVVHATPVSAILDAAHHEPFDLIVMGTHGRTGVGRFVAGSIAERVMRRAPCDVLSVKLPRPVRAQPVLGDARVARRAASSFSLFGAPGTAIARAISRPWR